LKNNAIIITLLLFLAVTSFFWFQSSRITDLEATKRITPPAISGKDAEDFVKLAEKLLIKYRDPLPELYGRDPFLREVPVEEIQLAERKPSEIFALSSIIYSDLHALAVVNGEILAEGDTLYSEEAGSEFIIESIEVDRVQIIGGDKKYTLEKKYEADSNR